MMHFLLLKSFVRYARSWHLPIECPFNVKAKSSMLPDKVLCMTIPIEMKIKSYWTKISFSHFCQVREISSCIGPKKKLNFRQVDTESHEPLPDGGLPVRGDELALRRGRVHPTKDPHRRMVWGHLLQDSWGAFSSFCDCFLNFSCCFFPSLLSQSLHYRANPIWNQSDLKLRLLSCNLDVPSPKFDAVRTQSFRFGRQFHPMKIKSHSLDTIKKSCYFTLKQSLGWR